MRIEKSSESLPIELGRNLHMWVIPVEMTYPDVCIVPIFVVAVQNLINTYQPWKQLNTKTGQVSENSKGGKNERLLIFLYKAHSLENKQQGRNPSI